MNYYTAKAMKPYFMDEGMTLYHGDGLEVLCTLPSDSVHCVVLGSRRVIAGQMIHARSIS
jgi:hypothetical protein